MSVGCPSRGRREALRRLGRWAAVGAAAALFGRVTGWSCAPGEACASCSTPEGCEQRWTAATFVWQLDPNRCVQCGRCATSCVLTPSAVKCVHAFEICGYCKLCFGFFQPGAVALTEAAENQRCPVGAIRRRFVEPPYFEYTIDEELCVGCGRCVKGCTTFGNGSLHLQVRHDRCARCNECAIGRDCPSRAFRRVPAAWPYLVKRKV